VNEELKNQPYSVLIVDDEPTNIEFLLEVFEILESWRVHATASPREALDIYRDNVLSLVLLDITMPEMDGFEVLDEFSKIAVAKPPVVYVLTGHHDAQTREKAIQKGAYDVITKPFTVDAIIELVERIQAKS